VGRVIIDINVADIIYRSPQFPECLAIYPFLLLFQPDMSVALSLLPRLIAAGIPAATLAVPVADFQVRTARNTVARMREQETIRQFLTGSEGRVRGVDQIEKGCQEVCSDRPVA